MKKVGGLVTLLLAVTTLSIRAADYPVFNIGDLNNALRRAESGDRVLVHRGNYVGNFTVPAGVALLGEPEFIPVGAQRPFFLPWDAAPIVLAFTREGEKTPTRVCGIFFTTAKNSAVEVRGDGAGLLCNNYFEQNRGPRGGAIFTEASGSLCIHTNYFSSNTAETDGGAVYLGGMANVSLRRNEFMGNVADANGGGVCVRGDNKVVSDRDFFMNNRAVQDGGAVAILVNQSGFTLHQAWLTANRAGRDGGGVAVDEASVLVAYGSSDTSTAGRHGGFLSARKGVALLGGHNCQTATAGDHGGGVYAEAALFWCQDNQVRGCRALFGAGMAIQGKPAVGDDPAFVSRTTFIDNRAVKDGGALWLADLPEVRVENNVIFMNRAGVGDGLMIAADATATVAHNTFAHIQYVSGLVNSLPTATAVQIAGANNATRVVNNIVFGHLRGVIGDANVRALVAGNDFWLTPAPWFGVPMAPALLNRQCVNPQFVQCDPRRMIGDFHLQANSPCRNVAIPQFSPLVDRDGRRRDAQPDRGAYEFFAP